MKNKIHFILIGSFLVLSLSSCSKKQNLNADQAGSGGSSFSEPIPKDSDSNNAFGLETVYFEYDSVDFAANSKAILKKNADILKRNRNIHIQIEGHCDERGGIQYNLALGEKRARAIQQYLLGQGVSKSRTTVISFGKERPINTGDSEESHAKNRRGNFVITSEE